MTSTSLARAARGAQAFLIALGVAVAVSSTAWAKGETHPPASPEVIAARIAVLMQQPLGGHTGRAMAWAQYLAGAGLERDADDLFRAALDSYLTTDGRERPDRSTETVGQAIERARHLSIRVDDRTLQQQLARIMHSQLTLVPLGPLGPLVRSSGPNAAPGAQTPATHELSNRGPQPLVLERFLSHQRTRSGAVEPLACVSADQVGPMVILPQETRKVYCRAAVAADPQRQGQIFRPPGSPDFAATVDEQAYDARRMLLHLAPATRDEILAFQRTHAPCGLRSTCEPAVVAAGASGPASAAATLPPERSTERSGSGRRWRQIQGLLVLVAVFPVYALIAYRRGTPFATRAFTALSCAGALAVMGSQFVRPWADDALIGEGLAFALLGVTAVTLAGYVLARLMAPIYQTLFGTRRAAPPADLRDAGLVSTLR